MIVKIVSGGQTGVDRAALDVARALGLAAGGWCPKGRLAEDGVIPEIYPLAEAKSADAIARTRLNVRDSDATLILAAGPLAGGTRATLEAAEAAGRPHHVAALDDEAAANDAAAWLADTRPGVLNVAGPRESAAPGIQDAAADFLKRLLVRPGTANLTPKRS